MINKRLTYIILGIFLILSGLASLISGMGALGIVIAIFALAAGVLILITGPGISYRIGWVLAAIYLILLGLLGIIDFSFAGMGIVMAVLALVAGVLLLIRAPKLQHHIGFLLFCIWLILVGLIGLIGLNQLGTAVAIIAIASGVLMILNE